MTPNHHTLLIDETEIPKKYKPVLARLAQAVQNMMFQFYKNLVSINSPRQIPFRTFTIG